MLTAAPLERYVSTFRSSGLISISLSPSISGMTSTAANEVCLLPEASNGEMRTSLCTPDSLFR
jgi:hypothetical protein